MNHKTKSGWTALHLCVQERNMEALKLLLKREDLDINVQDNGGDTVAMYAMEAKPMLLEIVSDPRFNFDTRNRAGRNLIGEARYLAPR